MIKFFRKIRQKLLSDGKIADYIKYAVGEILLVVVGILIALQINNWNTNRLDRISERDYLTRISNDLSVDTVNFSWTINTLEAKQESLGAILELINNGQLKTADSAAVISYLFTGALLSIGHPGIASGTYEELKNTGAMKNVTNTQLRSALNDYYFLREHQNDRIEKRREQSDYGSEVSGIIPGFRRTEGELSYRSDLVSYPEILDIINSPGFVKAAVSEYNFGIFMLKIQEGGLANSKELLDLVNEELGK